MLVLILSEVRRYLSTLVLFSVSGYFVITLIALVTVIAVIHLSMYIIFRIFSIIGNYRILDIIPCVIE